MCEKNHGCDRIIPDLGRSGIILGSKTEGAVWNVISLPIGWPGSRLWQKRPKYA
jgi:hypothetical protein